MNAALPLDRTLTSGSARPLSSAPDWATVALNMLTSRALDDLEQSQLLPARKVLYQFSASGHELTQSLLAGQMSGARDAVAVYYRSRPLLLGMGFPLLDALASTMMRRNSASGGRDIGVVFNWPRRNQPCVLPACGGVGTQYTPAIGWAQALQYRERVLQDAEVAGCIAVAHGGDASTATNGFWAALNVATTQKLPILFFIEDNGYGISVKSDIQTPGGNFAANLASFRNLLIHDGDGTAPLEAASLIADAVAHVRNRRGPSLLRLRVPRLNGHSGQDTQTYKSSAEIAAERARDPLHALRSLLVPGSISARQWQELEEQARQAVSAALAAVEAGEPLDTTQTSRFVFTEKHPDGVPILQLQGGVRPDGFVAAQGTAVAQTDGPRINMMTAIRRTLEQELATNPRVVLFGEDVGRKGGVHAATLGLQERFGADRVFDTNLSEEGIIGRAVGMALAGLMPVPEIQFRKYAEPAAEQLADCGTIRWRTANRFAAPMVVRMPGGFFKCGDPWHSQSNEVQFVHAIGWRVAMPSNAADAVGLLRTALRGNEPTIFFEHRSLLDGASARRPYPGDEYSIDFGKAHIVRAGTLATVVSWGAMVERCEAAITQTGIDAELIDLRTLMPWDRETVLNSVRQTGRCLIVHEDNITAGFGAEIAAVLARDAFFDLDAPIERLAMPDVPSPHSPEMLNAVLPDAAAIGRTLATLVAL